MTSYNVKNYYHVTNRANLKKILTEGLIDPQFATSKRKLSWYVDYDHIAWAIAHCHAKHRGRIDDLVVCKVRAQNRYMHQMSTVGLYATKRKFSVVEVINALEHLLREEARVEKLQAQIDGNDWYEHLREKS